MKTAFAAVGLFVVLMAVASQLHIGHFRLYYGNNPHGCADMESKIGKESRND